MLGGKKKYKCRFDVKVEKVEGLPDKMKGCPFRVEYNRGKDLTGMSRTLTMTSSNMSLSYSFKVECNLLYEEKKGIKKFVEKSLSIILVAEKSKDVKKESNIAKCEVDLVQFAVPGDYEPKQRLECHGKDKGDSKCVLIVSFKTEVLKIDGKKLVKVDPNAKKSSKGANKVGSSGDDDHDPYADLPDFGDDTESTSSSKINTVSVGGQEYDLQTDMEISEAGNDSDGTDKTENDYLSDSGGEGDDKDPFEQDSAPTQEQLNLAKKMEEDEKESAKEKKRKEEEADKKRKEEEAASKKAKEDEDNKKKKKDDDEKSSKEAEKKRKEDEKKAKEEEDKKRREEEKRVKEEEDKRKKEEKKAKEEEDKRKKQEEKKSKEEEDKRKKDEKTGKTSATDTSKAGTSTPATNNSPSSSRDTSSSVTSAASAVQIAQLESQLAALKSERDNALAEVKKLKNDLSSEKENVNNLKKNVKKLEGEKQELEEEFETFKKTSSLSSTVNGSSNQQEQIIKLENQVKNLKKDKQELQNQLEIAHNETQKAESVLASFDYEYSQKQISDLETENARLRQVLDDNNLLKGNLIQELKHRQSERNLRVLQHAKDIEAGVASEKEITAYKPKHSRQNSLEDSAGSSHSSSRSPRLQDSSSSSSKKDIDKSASKKDSSDKSSSSKATAKEEKEKGSLKDSKDDGKSSSSFKDTKDSKKKPSISMDDDEPTIPSKGSKRVGASNATSSSDLLSLVPSIIGGASSTSGSPSSFDSMGGSGAYSNQHMQDLTDQIKNNKTIEDLLYNSSSEYDSVGTNKAASQLSQFILNDAKAFERQHQHSESSHELLVHILNAIYGQLSKYNLEVSVLVGLLQFSTTLLKNLIANSEVMEDHPPASHVTWVSTVEENGIYLKFDALSDVNDTMGSRKLKVEKAFDDVAADATPAEAFMVLLDQLITYNYCLIFECLQSLVDAEKMVELFFGQTGQLSAMLNGSNPLAKPSSATGSGGKISGGGGTSARPLAMKPMTLFTAPLEVFLTASKKHKLYKSVESQLLGQLFYWCSATLVNTLVASGDKCCAATGMSLKVAISHVEQWISQNTFKRLSQWVEDQFAASRDAANVLTIDKHIFQSIDALEGIFTSLNIAQIHKLLTQFQVDDFAPDPVPKITLDVLRSTISKTNAKVTYLDGTTLLLLFDPET